MRICVYYNFLLLLVSNKTIDYSRQTTPLAAPPTHLTNLIATTWNCTINP